MGGEPAQPMRECPAGAHRFCNDHPERMRGSALPARGAWRMAALRAREGEQQQFVDRIAGLLASEQRAGRTSADFNPAVAAQVMVWACEQVIACQLARDSASDGEVARELASLQWYGVYRRPR